MKRGPRDHAFENGEVNEGDKGEYCGVSENQEQDGPLALGARGREEPGSRHGMSCAGIQISLELMRAHRRGGGWVLDALGMGYGDFFAPLLRPFDVEVGLVNGSTEPRHTWRRFIPYVPLVQCN